MGLRQVFGSESWLLQLRFEPQRVGSITSSQVSNFKPNSEGFIGDLFIPKPHFSKFFSFRIHGLVHEPILEHFWHLKGYLLKFELLGYDLLLLEIKLGEDDGVPLPIKI